MSTQISSYEQAAIDFLAKTNTKMEVEFLKFDYHFSGDSQKRNIFKITLSNSRHKYSFNFGASLNDSLSNVKDISNDKILNFFFGLKFEGLKVKYLSFRKYIKYDELKGLKTFKDYANYLPKNEIEKIYNDFVKENTSKYQRLVNILPFDEFFEKITQKLLQESTKLENGNWGEGIQAANVIHPTAYDVLACIEKYEVGSFEDFCGNFGYDTDSRNAVKVYKAVRKESENVRKLFTEQEIELLQEIN